LQKNTKEKPQGMLRRCGLKIFYFFYLEIWLLLVGQKALMR